MEAMTRHLACAVVACGAARVPWDWEEEGWIDWEEVEWEGWEEEEWTVEAAGSDSAGGIEAGLDSAEVVEVLVVVVVVVAASVAAASAR